MIPLRTLTLGLDHETLAKHEFEALVSTFCNTSRALAEQASLPLRTHRLVLKPVNEWKKVDPFGANAILQWVASLCQGGGPRWFCVPFELAAAAPATHLGDIALEVIKRTKNSFVNMIIARGGQTDVPAVVEAARFVRSVSALASNGYENFRVGVSANVPANGPFFPFTYHTGRPAFSIGAELTKPMIALVQAATPSEPLPSLRERIVGTLLPELRRIEEFARLVEQRTGVEYRGIDLSLAPFPEPNHSVAQLIEELGLESFGGNGTVFLISWLTDILRSFAAELKTVGFNGVMISVLEDQTLSTCNKNKLFAVDSLLAYATVCGCGLDMVPIPGSTFVEEIAGMCLDVAALSAVHRKPLGVRLLPIPDKLENEHTDFSFDFLYNTRVMGVRNRIFSARVLDAREPISYRFPLGGRTQP